MKALCVIPARLGSTRLPRKMLANLQGKPLIQHTYLRAKSSELFDKIIVATDSEEIADKVHELGGETLMTPKEIATGSDRVAFVAKKYSDIDVVVNLQGDEPFMAKSSLKTLLSPYLQGENPDMATVGFELDKEKEWDDPSIVKVIVDQKGYGIYFSRSKIPYLRQQVANLPVLHHMGLYAYKRDFLLHYTSLPQTPLEQAEALEQLRAIEHGYKIKVLQVSHKTIEINTQEELDRAQHFQITS